MQTRPRIFAIDILRALAIIGVMVIHTLALYLGPPAINETWNYLEFVVITFVACSGYVNWLSFGNSKKKFLPAWYGKRFIRLYMPYILYVAAIAILTHSFSSSSIFLTGGIDVGWLTLLFMQLALVTPVFIWITRDNKRNMFSLIIFGLIALVMVFVPVASTYSRAVAWIPWSFIYLLGMNVAKMATTQKRDPNYSVIAVGIALLVWLALDALLNARGAALTFTLHKYPPDLFYLSYGIAVTGVLLWLVTLFEKVFAGMQGVIMFFSLHSYGMFFMQLIVLRLLTMPANHLSLFPAIILSILVTSLVIWVWGRVVDYVRAIHV